MRQFMNLFETELPMDTASRMQRAKAMGFTIRAYHGTGAKFDEFDLEKGRARSFTGFAPHFADKKAEANGYAKKRKAEGSPEVHVIHVLLRVKNPWINNYDDPVSAAQYEQLVGHPPEGKWDLPFALTDFEKGKYEPGDHRPRWAAVYRKLIKLGYDAILDPNTPGDHSDGPYGKYVVLDPKNVRSINARFDPAKSESRNLMD